MFRKMLFPLAVIPFLGACAGNPQPEPELSPQQLVECKAFVRIAYDNGKDRYDCDEWLGNGTYYLTAWVNNGKTVVPFAKFDEYDSCAAHEASLPIREMRHVESGGRFYEVDEIWCVRNAGTGFAAVNVGKNPF